VSSRGKFQEARQVAAPLLEGGAASKLVRRSIVAGLAAKGREGLVWQGHRGRDKEEEEEEKEEEERTRGF
jgi:hypothetical protein